MYFPSFSFWRTAPVIASTFKDITVPGSPYTVNGDTCYTNPNIKNITVSGDLYIVNGDTCYATCIKEGYANHTKEVRRAAVLAGVEPDKGSFPGPIINGWKGSTFKINVHNQLKNDNMLRETTIHWHGIEQKVGTNWADGVAFVTQCPIIPDDSFPYNFPVPDQAGTFWYHSHYSTQYCDGLRGPFIIRDKEDPYLNDYDVDDDSTVITLSDWYEKLATGGPSGWDLTLINGAVTPEIIVKQGTRYRFRLINMSCDAPYMFSIDGHNLTVIEADGVLTKKYTVTQIPILAAQRYSFILDTHNHHPGKYWIHAEVPTEKGPGGTAILRYEGVPDYSPVKPPPITPVTLDEALLVPYYPAPAPGGHTIDAKDVENHDIEMNSTKEGFVINGAHFRPPSVDVLLQILSGAKSPNDILPKGSVISLPRDANIQLKFKNAGATRGAPHPFHLHGHTFSVIRSINHDDYIWDNPPRRDTVSTSRFNNDGKNLDEVTIRFRTDNPGPWILHCHIDWHLERGLAVVFAEDINGTADWQKGRPDKWSGLCDKYWKWMGQPRQTNKHG